MNRSESECANRLLTRKEAALFLSDFGLKMSASDLGSRANLARWLQRDGPELPHREADRDLSSILEQKVCISGKSNFRPRVCAGRTRC